MRYLSEKDLVELVSPAALIAVLEEALRDLAAGRASVPHVSTLTLEAAHC